MSDELIKRIKERCAGRIRWQVMNAAEDGYCIEFDWKTEADEWMSRYMQENPDYIRRNGYHIVEQRTFTTAERLANEAVDLIEQQAARIAELEARAGETIPQGFALVPLKPDDAMQLAGSLAVRMNTTVLNRIWTANAVFKAMCAAAPIPPTGDAAGKDSVDAAVANVHSVVTPKGNPCEVRVHLTREATDADRQRILAAFRTPTEFEAHGELDSEGWTPHVFPERQYWMQCCDCGLVHEMEFAAVKTEPAQEGFHSDELPWPENRVRFRVRRAAIASLTKTADGEKQS